MLCTAKMYRHYPRFQLDQILLASNVINLTVIGVKFEQVQLRFINEGCHHLTTFHPLLTFMHFFTIFMHLIIFFYYTFNHVGNVLAKKKKINSSFIFKAPKLFTSVKLAYLGENLKLMMSVIQIFYNFAPQLLFSLFSLIKEYRKVFRVDLSLFIYRRQRSFITHDFKEREFPQHLSVSHLRRKFLLFFYLFIFFLFDCFTQSLKSRFFMAQIQGVL